LRAGGAGELHERLPEWSRAFDRKE